MNNWNQRTPRNHDELRKWHQVAPGISWRLQGTTIPSIELCLFRYVLVLPMEGVHWCEAEQRAIRCATTIKKALGAGRVSE